MYHMCIDLPSICKDAMVPKLGVGGHPGYYCLRSNVLQPASIKVHTEFTVDFLLEAPFPLYPYHHLHSCLWLQKQGTPMNKGYGYE